MGDSDIRQIASQGWSFLVLPSFEGVGERSLSSSLKVTLSEQRMLPTSTTPINYSSVAPLQCALPVVKSTALGLHLENLPTPFSLIIAMWASVARNMSIHYIAGFTRDG